MHHSQYLIGSCRRRAPHFKVRTPAFCSTQTSLSSSCFRQGLITSQDQTQSTSLLVLPLLLPNRDRLFSLFIYLQLFTRRRHCLHLHTSRPSLFRSWSPIPLKHHLSSSLLSTPSICQVAWLQVVPLTAYHTRAPSAGSLRFFLF